jgi:hypothetical protein
MEGVMAGGWSGRKVLQVFAGLAIVLCSASWAGAAVTQQQISDFLANPSSLLQQFPTGGARMISMVRDLACTEHSTLQPIARQLGTANKDQQSAIGTGLGQCARSVVNSDQAYANSIGQAIAASGSENANLAYSGVTQNVATAATAPGGGAGGGGVGGPSTNTGIPFGGANSGNGSTQGDRTSQTAFTNSSGSVGVSGTTPSGSVSPR